MPETEAIGGLVLDGTRLCTAFSVGREEVAIRAPYEWRRVWEALAVVAGHRFGGDLQFQSPSARVTVERGQERWYPAEPFRVRVVAVSRPPLGWDLMVASFYSHRPVVGVRLASDERIEPGEPLLLVGHGGGMLGSVSGRFVGTEPGRVAAHRRPARGRVLRWPAHAGGRGSRGCHGRRHARPAVRGDPLFAWPL
jgi:hypothetical protein